MMGLRKIIKTKSATILGKNLKWYRENSKLTKGRLSKLIGVHRAQVGKWETGTSFPSAQNIDKLTNVFGIAPTDLFITENAKKKS